MADGLLSFFVVIRKQDDTLAIRRLHTDATIQRQLTEHFMNEYSNSWSGGDNRTLDYALSIVPQPDIVMRIKDFTLAADVLLASTNPIHFTPFKLPLPAGESLKGVFGCRAGFFVFQVCDSRHLLRHKFSLFQDNNAFRRLNEDALSIGDSLSGFFDKEGLHFRSLTWLGRMLDVGSHYEEATRDQARTLFTHQKFKLPDSHKIDAYLDLLTPSMMRQITVVLRAKTMDDADVTPGKIKDYIKKYYDLEMKLRGTLADRSLELPVAPEQIRILLRSLDEGPYTSELTQKPREALSYSSLKKPK